MGYHLIVRLNLFPENSGGRKFFQATGRELIGGIPFRLKSWDSNQFITCFIVAPRPGFKFDTPQEIIVPLLLSSTEDILKEICVGSVFDLWEGRVTATGVVLGLYY